MATEPRKTYDQKFVNSADIPWRPSTFTEGVTVKDVATTEGCELQIVRFNPGARFPVHTLERPEFIYILEGELIQAGRRLGPGWASVSGTGSVDGDVRTQKGCVFLLVDRA